MTEITPGTPDSRPHNDSVKVNCEELLLLLRRKESNWVEWGKACQQLQKAGYSAQAIFEATGFEPIQQNQVIVAAQVHDTLMKEGVSENVRSRFERTGSDSLYELRILTQPERAVAAEFIVARNLDSEGAREVAKALKDFSRMGTPPAGFSNHPGDVVAYQYWKVARYQNSLTERSRLIARGLMFAHSQEARQQIEQLLTEGIGGNQHQPPRLPFYRLEADDFMPRLLPVIGKLPLTVAEWEAVSTIESTGSFGIVKTSNQQSLVAIPGWQIVRKAQDPVVVLCHSNQLPGQPSNKLDELLLVVDRNSCQWSRDSYFLLEQSGQVEVHWFPEAPNVSFLGRLILVLRPKKILDEPLSSDLWQVEE
ncbi:MAG: hypothetical protein F6J86_33295 [Symploca sp. SIO1B1]|nr:hypothetical protein [Symploca sp. SIO1C2]NER98648.1 hypothetical protein [Symploca sp. SIO1B1]